jgi:hypothetical protein
MSLRLSNVSLVKKQIISIYCHYSTGMQEGLIFHSVGHYATLPQANKWKKKKRMGKAKGWSSIENRFVIIHDANGWLAPSWRDWWAYCKQNRKWVKNKRQWPFQLALEQRRLLSRLWRVADATGGIALRLRLHIGAEFHMHASSVYVLLILHPVHLHRPWSQDRQKNRKNGRG